MDSIGIIGIGAMGRGIAKNLLKSGYSVYAHARDTQTGLESAEALRHAGATICKTTFEIFEQVGTLILCVPNSNIVESLLIGEHGLGSCMGNKVKTVLDFSTSHPDSTNKIATILEPRGIRMLDCPMTGSVREAEEGTIKLIVGGAKDLFDEQEDLFKSVAEVAYFAGRQGSGNLVKLANNYLSILDQVVTANVSLVLDKYGVSLDVYEQFLSGSSANSGGFRLMINRIKTGDFKRKFELGLATKDIGYCKDVYPFTITEDLFSILEAACEAGYRNDDVGTVYHYLKKL